MANVLRRSNVAVIEKLNAITGSRLTDVWETWADAATEHDLLDPEMIPQPEPLPADRPREVAIGEYTIRSRPERFTATDGMGETRRFFVSLPAGIERRAS